MGFESGESGEHFSAPLQSPWLFPIQPPLALLLCQYEGGGGQRKQWLHKIGQRVAFTPKMLENRTDWLSLNKYLSSPSTHPSHSDNQDSHSPCSRGPTGLLGFSYSNAHHCYNSHHPQRSSLLCTQDYVKNQVQKILGHPYSWVKFGESYSPSIHCKVDHSGEDLIFRLGHRRLTCLHIVVTAWCLNHRKANKAAHFTEMCHILSFIVFSIL